MTDIETLTEAFSKMGVHYAMGEHLGSKLIMLCSEEEAHEFRDDPERAYAALKWGQYFEFGPEGDLWSYN